MNAFYVHLLLVFVLLSLSFFLIRWLKEYLPFNKKIAYGSLSVIALLFAIRTMSRVPDWKDPLSLDLQM
ncbi:MAG: hypothetical protein C4329_10725 [Chitinophagaceae bacterium]